MSKIQTTPGKITINGKILKLHEVVGETRIEIIKLLRESSLDDHKIPRLPGPSPVSLERSDFEKLKTGRYVVAEKTNGVRFVLFFHIICGYKICCIVDRAMKVFLFPFQHIPKVLFQGGGTMYDGELCIDKSSGKFVFVVFDAVVVSGITVSHMGLSERLQTMSRSIKEFKMSPNDPAELRFKGVIPISAPEIIKQHLETVENIYDVDGIVITPLDDPVVYGRHTNMFKLKPAGHHTVDFIVLNSNGELGSYNPRTKSNVKIGQLVGDRIPDFGTIVECSYIRGNLWKFVSIRSDKKFANDVLTMEKTLLNIRENISVSEIFNLFK